MALLTAAGVSWPLALAENTIYDVVLAGRPERGAAFIVAFDLPIEEFAVFIGTMSSCVPETHRGVSFFGGSGRKPLVRAM